MEYRALGRTGVQVSQICLGTMMFGGKTDREESIRMIDHALDQGVNFVDTADVYAGNESERIVGEALEQDGRRRNTILATKFNFPQGEDVNARGVSRRHLIDACDASLLRLRTDWIDLYQMHRCNADVPIDETLRAFEDLVRMGKVRYVGCSNYPAWRLGEALRAADRLGVSGYISVQPRYNLLYREIEVELLPLCRDQGIGVIVYNPLAGGFLSGKYRPGQAVEEGTRFTLGTSAQMYQQRYWQDAQFDAVETLKAVVEAQGLNMVSVAVAWVLAQPFPSFALFGPRSAGEIVSTLPALDIALGDDDVAWLNLETGRR